MAKGKKALGPVIGQNKLKSILKTARETNRKTQKLNGDLGQEIKALAENDHLHKQAFAFVRKCDKMEAEELAHYLATVEYYLDVTGLQDRADSAPAFSVIQGGKDGEGEQKPQTEAAE